MHIQRPRLNGREDTTRDLFETPALEADPGAPGADESLGLRPFAALTTPDARVDAPGTESLDPERILELARDAASRDRKGEAATLLGELLALEPGHLGAAVGLAVLLEERQDTAGALEVVAAALKVRPDAPELLLTRAGIHRRQKDLSEAESDARRVLRTHPAHPDALFELGLVLLRRGLAAEAGQMLVRRAEIRPDDAETWYYIGEARNQAGTLPAALEALKRAAALNDRDGRTWHLMGRVLDRMGRPDEAMPMYRRSRDLASP
jgi:tetratricopeptide (TPR) repeat protein